jgi:hypothetical protein
VSWKRFKRAGPHSPTITSASRARTGGRSFLDLPENLMIYSGMAVGFGDQDAPINRWRSPREPLDNFATFSGFTN